MIRNILSPLKNRAAGFSLVLGLTILTGTIPCHARPAPEPAHEEMREIESRLSSQMEALGKLDEIEKELLTKLALLEKEAAETRQSITELDRKARETKAEMDTLSQKLEHLQGQSTAAESKISSKLIELYKHARTRYATIIADVTDIGELLRRLKYLGVIMAEERHVLIRAASQARAYQEEMGKTETRLNELKDTSRDETTRLASLKKELEEKVRSLVRIHEEKEFYETSIQELQVAAEGLGQALQDIEKKETYHTNGSCHFEDFKGKLLYPMSGKVRYNTRASQSARAGKYKGVVIEGPLNSDVKAIFPGKVVFSGSLKGYGQLVIINHGSRFYTVSAHLSERTKIEGDVVEAGETVGRVGSKDASKGSKLYFEIRRAGEGLNPREWLKAQ